MSPAEADRSVGDREDPEEDDDEEQLRETVNVAS
jgi:hypothetical protein